MYQLDATLPPEAAQAVDSSEPVVEVIVLWGDEVLAVEHVPARADMLPSDSIELARRQCEAKWSAHPSVTYLVRTTSAARSVGSSVLRALEWGAQRWTVLSFAAHAGMLALFYLLPPHTQARNYDLSYAQERWARVEVVPIEIEPMPVWNEGQGADGERASTPPSQKARAGGSEPRPEPRVKRASVRGEPSMSTRAQQIDAARNSGLAELIRTGTQPALAAMFDGAHARARELGEGQGELLAYGGGVGSELGRGVGIGRGTGDGSGTVDVGGIGTIGGGPGGDGGGGRGRYGTGVGRFGGRGERVPPKITIQDPMIRGGLSKETIRRTIRMHLSEVRHCYEQALVSRPDLQGRITVSFTIAGTGAVQSAAISSSDLGDAGVEACIAKAVRLWTFSQPEGGGMVVVSYPFMLTHTGN